MGEATTDPVRLPPAPRIPKLLQGVGFLVNRDKVVATAARRYGSEFTLNVPIFGHAGGESMHSRGVATAPGRGGLAVVHRRVRVAESVADGAAQVWA